jgi:kynurenine formamidase
MCLPACRAKIAKAISRRRFFRKAGLGSVAALTVACNDESSVQENPPALSSTFSFQRMVDLTHPLSAVFPTFSGQPQVELETIATAEEGLFNMKKWTIEEHVGTHLDAPFHVSDQATADQIPVEQLWGPLAVIDIRAKAENDANAQLTPTDLRAWENQYGPLPDGAVVAMNSGWGEYVNSDKFRNADTAGNLRFPGFHVETTQFLLEERKVKGLMVDTLSLDPGNSAEFEVHMNWLPQNKWGVECVANLGELPAHGAIAIIGGPKIVGASGGPGRFFALV